MDEKKLKELLDRFQNGTCTAEEIQMVDKLYLDILKERTRSEEMEEMLLIYHATKQRLQKEEMISRRHIPVKFTVKRSVAIAAAVIGIIVVSSIAYYSIRTHPVPSPQSVTQDIPPGSNKATLTLAGGQQILLDDSKEGDIAQASGITIKKTKAGKLIYAVTKNADNNTVASYQVNTVTTPRGGQYEIVLEDGTKVWLNAASKITFPASFAGLKERQITLSGEAYFEVAKNPRKPFSVSSAEQLVTVTGTHFNVSCYADEPTKTTLAEGSVVVFHPATREKLLMKPRQQTITTPGGMKIVAVNPNDVISWKDGVFVFNGTPMVQVMKQIGRWYNVDVDYSSLPGTELDGEFPRNLSLSQVLKLIEISGMVKFKTEGRKIMIER